MKGAAALWLVLLTIVGCAAVDHGLRLRLAGDRRALAELRGRLEAWEASPAGRRLAHLRERQTRLESQKALFRDVPARNGQLRLLLAALDGLGGELRQVDYDGQGSLRIEVAGQAEQLAGRLGKLPLSATFVALDGSTVKGTLP